MESFQSDLRRDRIYEVPFMENDDSDSGTIQENLMLKKAQDAGFHSSELAADGRPMKGVQERVPSEISSDDTDVASGRAPPVDNNSAETLMVREGVIPLVVYRAVKNAWKNPNKPGHADSAAAWLMDAFRHTRSNVRKVMRDSNVEHWLETSVACARATKVFERLWKECLQEEVSLEILGVDETGAIIEKRFFTGRKSPVSNLRTVAGNDDSED